MASLTSHCLWRLLPILALQGWLSLVIPSVSPQIVPDQTLGAESSRVRTVNNSHQVIEGGANRGSHLFHSFDVFNIGAGRAAYFASSPGTLNIFSRVTGNDVSDIFGTLGVDGTANLYLLNPNGIVFGPNARLDVSGSFVASTANRLVFDDGQFFGAFPTNQPPLLQINVTPGLQYGNNLNATISNQGHLQVGQNLTLGAQRLELAGSLEAERDIVLQGWSRDLSNADYTVGGYVFTENLGGQGVDLLIPHENVVLANGDVQFTQTYEGESLYVLAGGQVSQTGIRAITITGTSGGSTTEQIADGIGGTQSVTVTAGDQPTVDIRSGVNWLALTGELPGDLNASEAVVIFNAATGDGIELGELTNDSGDIVMSSVGDIIADDLTSIPWFSQEESTQGRDGGAIFLIAGNNINAHFIQSIADFTSDGNVGDVIGGNGGAISLVAGNSINVDSIKSISISELDSASYWPEFLNSGNVTGRNGGAISLVASNNINVDFISSGSESSSNRYSGNVTGGNGGVVSLVTGNNINVDFIYSSSDSISRWDSGSVTGGEGGAVSLVASNDINAGTIKSGSESTSLWDSGDVVGGDGGSVFLVASNNINVDFIDSISQSGSYCDSGSVTGGDGGSVSLVAGNNINAGFINSGSGSASRWDSSSVTGGDGGSVSLIAGNDINAGSIQSDSESASFWNSGDVVGGNGGAISLVASNNINASVIESASALALYWGSGDVTGGDGGGIDLVADNTISTSSVGSVSIVYLYSASGNMVGGDGESVSLMANNDINIGTIKSFSFSESDLSSEPFSGDVLGGSAGTISLKSKTGGIWGFAQEDLFSDELNSPSLLAFSLAEGDESGNGGDVILEAATQIGTESVTYPLEILTLSSSAQSGTVQITGLDENLNILNTSVLTNRAVEIENPFNYGIITIPVGGEGQSGDISVASIGDIAIRNSSFISETNSTNDAGDVTITSPGLVSFTNSFIDTNTYSSGQAGSVTFNAQDLVIQDGSAIATHTSGSGNGGDIKFNVSNRLDINDATILASTEAGSTGDGGDINVDPTTTLIRNGGNIAVNSVGQGQGGNISITSDDLFLDQGSITAETLTGFGGNIELNIQDLLFMEHSSFISTSAGTAQTGGDGGNIAINMPNGFLIAPYGADSDIVAHAAEGTGGNIDITAQGIYGFVEQPAIRGNGLNDIDASSEFSHNQMVSFDDLLVDPNQDSPASLANVLATGQLISPSCQVSSHLREDLALSSRDRIVEAQGWGRNANGQLMLQADVPNISAKQTKLFAASCQSNR